MLRRRSDGCDWHLEFTLPLPPSLPLSLYMHTINGEYFSIAGNSLVQLQRWCVLVTHDNGNSGETIEWSECGCFWYVVFHCGRPKKWSLEWVHIMWNVPLWPWIRWCKRSTNMRPYVDPSSLFHQKVKNYKNWVIMLSGEWICDSYLQDGPKSELFMSPTSWGE